MIDMTSVLASGSPAIPGLGFRRLRDGVDYTDMVTVRDGSRDWDQVDVQSPREEVPTVEEMAATFPLGAVQGHPDLLIATIDEQIIGYSHVFWRWTEITGVRVYLHLGYVLPPWRGQGIGSAMLHWGQPYSGGRCPGRPSGTRDSRDQRVQHRARSRCICAARGACCGATAQRHGVGTERGSLLSLSFPPASIRRLMPEHFSAV